MCAWTLCPCSAAGSRCRRPALRCNIALIAAPKLARQHRAIAAVRSRANTGRGGAEERQGWTISPTSPGIRSALDVLAAERTGGSWHVPGRICRLNLAGGSLRAARRSQAKRVSVCHRGMAPVPWRPEGSQCHLLSCGGTWEVPVGRRVINGPRRSCRFPPPEAAEARGE